MYTIQAMETTWKVYDEEALSIQLIPYCSRDGRSMEINRKNQTCAPDSKIHWSSNLCQRNVSVREVLHWNSSIGVAVQYTAFFSGDVDRIDGTVCECKTSGNFVSMSCTVTHLSRKISMHSSPIKWQSLINTNIQQLILELSGEQYNPCPSARIDYLIGAWNLFVLSTRTKFLCTHVQVFSLLLFIFLF